MHYLVMCPQVLSYSKKTDQLNLLPPHTWAPTYFPDGGGENGLKIVISPKGGFMGGDIFCHPRGVVEEGKGGTNKFVV